jgi:hypothetical protein
MTVFGPEAPNATGSGSATFVLSPTELSISASWSGLSGTTAVAHIHCCTATPGTGTVGVAVTPGTLIGFPAGVTSGTYDFTVDLTTSTSFTAGFITNFGGGTVDGARLALGQGFADGSAYFNIHTTTFPGGEIRGFIEPVPVPEPGGAALVGVALLAFVIPVARRRAPDRHR